jgi:hypothetical protein
MHCFCIEFQGIPRIGARELRGGSFVNISLNCAESIENEK